MTAPLYLSRARLRTRRGEALASIAPLLIPDGERERHAAQHRIVWLLFQADPDIGHTLDWRKGGHGFLWRDEGGGRFLILSRQMPTDPKGLFELDSKPFMPELAAGDRLRFALRANPVAARKPARAPGQEGMRTRGKRVDVVMDALKPIAETDWEARTGRAFERDRIVLSATRSWFSRQGDGHGFTLRSEASFSAEGYTKIQIERTTRRSARRPAGISVVDLAGEIEVTDPSAFLARLPLGFGSAKAFGCGLMLIRRA
jgi:CRISPR system Cascade subunit CasE